MGWLAIGDKVQEEAHSAKITTCDHITEQGGCFGKCNWDWATHTCGPIGMPVWLAIGDKVQESGLAQIQKKTKQPPWDELKGTPGDRCTHGQFCERKKAGGKSCQVPCPADGKCPAPKCDQGTYCRCGQQGQKVPC